MVEQAKNGNILKGINIHTESSKRKKIESLDVLNQAAAHVTFLSEAGRILASSIDLQKTFSHLADVLVPAVADACIISLIDPQGNIKRMAFKHIDSDRETLLQELDKQFPIDPRSNLGTPFVIRTRTAELVTDITNSPHMALRTVLAEQIGIRSYLNVPMFLMEDLGVIGSIWLGTTEESGRYLDSNDLNLVKDLAILAAQAVHNSSLYKNSIDESEKYKIKLKIRDEFIKKQIHDLSTPLTAISLNLQLLVSFEDNRSPQFELIVQRAIDNIGRAFNMIENLRSIQAGFEKDGNVPA